MTLTEFSPRRGEVDAGQTNGPMDRPSLWAHPIQLSSLLLFRVIYVYVLSCLDVLILTVNVF